MAATPKSTSRRLTELYSDNIVAKVVRTATVSLEDNNDPPTKYPEYVLQSGPSANGRWELRDKDFWTCGFFPGQIYALLERAVRWPGSLNVPSRGDGDAQKEIPVAPLIKHLEGLGKKWSEPLHETATRTDTHDMSFMIQPSLRRRWELLHDATALDSVLTAARGLHSRFNATVGAIRSWDRLVQHDVDISSLDEDFLVIVDSMCNLDLLYYAAAHTGDGSLADAATAHARTVKKTLFRTETGGCWGPDAYTGELYSTCHVVNLDPRTGEVKERRTAQGYAAESTWTRGQAWGILGFAQTFVWTRDQEFLDAACGLAEYFLHRLDTAPLCVYRPVTDGGEDGRTKGKWVPLWDFDAPFDPDATEAGPLRDASAGVIAANGLLVLSQALAGQGRHNLAQRYYEAAVDIVDDTLDLCLSQEKATFAAVEGGDQFQVRDVEDGKTFEAIVKHATANRNKSDKHQYWDHGLVYLDYYLIEFGNRLLQMGFV
ncbi:hypothetical protein ACKVWC_009162 [Pyricularia oryzae]